MVRTEVYALIVDDNSRPGYKDITHNGHIRSLTDASPLERAALMDLTLKSGGGTFFGDPQNTLRLQKIYSEIADEMRSHYTLGFYPDVIDTKLHSIKVRLRNVANANGFALAYRMSYQNEAKPAGR